MLVDFEPAAMCEAQDRLVLQYLPSPRALWEASDASSWKVAFDRWSMDGFQCGMSYSGDLVRLEKSGQKTTQGQTVDWQEWCSEMDSLGGLVMLAATLFE